MVDNKTPDADLERFEKFLNGMSEQEFDAWLQDPEITNKQKDFAETIREPVEEDDVLDIHKDALRSFYRRRLI